MIKHYIGIDIGGTYTRAVLIHGLKPHKVRYLKRETGITARHGEAVIIELIEERLKEAKEKRLGRGVGIAGSVDRKRGIFLRGENLPFKGPWDIRKFLRHFNAPVKVDNDAHCFLRAEKEWGAVRGYKNIFGLVIGTGIGGSIISDGKMVYGAHDGAVEAGFIVMDEKRERIFDELGAKKAFRQYGDRSRVIVMGIASIINLVDPEILVLGGGGVFSPSFHFKNVKKVTRRFVVIPGAKKTPIVKGKLGDAAQAIGAALLFAD